MKEEKKDHGKRGDARPSTPRDLSELFPLEPVPEDVGTAHEFSLLLKYINDARGLDCKQYKPNYLKRRISVRMRARSTPRYLDYMQLLKQDPEEYRQLLNDLTINVTEFFRDPDVYQAIRDKLLPDILEYKRGKRSNTIRIWSAGCATGEEPYSLAMLAWDCFSRQKEKDYWVARITATDLDDKSLHTAKRGRYPVINVLPGSQPERYFEREGEEWRVRNDILHMVKFYKADLMGRPTHRFMDMVVCRNVLIYFEKEMQKKLLLSFHQALRRDGFLVLGKSEAIVGTVGTQFEPYLRRERIYRKLEDPDGPVEGREGESLRRRSDGGAAGRGAEARKRA
jgi:chemotaxis protein methyltransferase CheR